MMKYNITEKIIYPIIDTLFNGGHRNFKKFMKEMYQLHKKECPKDASEIKLEQVNLESLICAKS